MEPHDNMTESDFQSMMREREDSWTIKEFRLDPRSRDYWSDRIDEAMEREENERL